MIDSEKMEEVSVLRIAIMPNIIIDLILVTRCALSGCSNCFERKRMDLGDFPDEEVVIELEPGIFHNFKLEHCQQPLEWSFMKCKKIL